MKQPRILVDMDDCLCDQTTPWLEEFNRRYNTHVTRQEFRYYKREKYLKKLVPELTSSDVFDIINTPGFTRNLSMMPGAIEALQEMKARGWRTVIVTSLPRARNTPGQMIQEKLEWIDYYLKGLIAERDIVITHEKYLVKGDILIDDAPHNLSVFPGATIAFHQPWNEHMTTTARVEHWDQVVDTCKSLLFLKSLWVRKLDER